MTDQIATPTSLVGTSEYRVPSSMETLRTPPFDIELDLPLLDCGEVGDGTRFEIRRLLGEGGGGSVYLARERGLDRDVAVKFLRRDTDANRAALLREARVAGSLEHPNIVPIFAIGLCPKRGPAVVMQRVIGESWRSHLIRARVRQDFDLRASIEVLMRVCEAVVHAHSRGVIHRDLKPDNVLLGRHGEVYVADWGVSFRVDEPDPHGDGIVGTPAYMAPEMTRSTGHGMTERTDVFLLGSILYELLYEAPPNFDDSVVNSVLKAARPTEFPDNGFVVPDALIAICRRACAFTPGERYASATELLAALRDEQRRAEISELVDRTSAELDDVLADEPDNESTPKLFELAAVFRGALDVDPGNTVAAAGSTRALSVALEYELRAGNLSTAQRLRTQLGDEASVELLTRLRRLEAERVGQREAAEEFDQLIASHDAKAGLRHGIWLLPLVLVLTSLGLLAQTKAFGSWFGFLQQPALRAGIFAGILIVFVGLLRDRLLRSKTSRVVAMAFVAAAVGICLTRIIGQTAALSDQLVHQINLIVTANASALLVLLHRRFLVVPGMLVGALVFELVSPETSPWVRRLSSLGGPALIFAVWASLPRGATVGFQTSRDPRKRDVSR